MKLFQTFSPTFKHIFLQNCPKEFVRFLSECVVNLMRGELDSLNKSDLISYKAQLKKLVSKRTTLKERRLILGSKKGLKLIEMITPPVITRLS